jgi:hypothetical protein
MKEKAGRSIRASCFLAYGLLTPQTQSGLNAFRSVTDIQVSPHSLPALTLGRNTVRFWHQSPEAVKVRVTHRWREIHDRRPPGGVEAAVSPPDSGEVASLSPIVKWLPAVHPDKDFTVVDYQVMVSLRPDCRWPLSPTLHQNVGSSKTEWQVPSSFLNPGTDYYWKARARDNKGTVGAWSRVLRFRTSDSAK